MKRLLASLLMMPFLLAGLAIPAAADDLDGAGPDIQLSADGVTWTSDLTEPLFDPDMRWVPGDSESSTFYVRNMGGSLGDLAVDVIAGRAGRLIDSGDLRITAMGGGGEWMPVDDGGRHRLLTALDVADGKVAAITVNVSFDETSPGFTQLESAPLEFVVTLAQAASLNDTDARGTFGSLPNTGAPGFVWVLLGATLLGCGSALAVDGRREQRRG